MFINPTSRESTTAFYPVHLAMFALFIILGSILSAFAVPSSPGECKPLSSLSFRFPPAVASGLSAQIIYNNLTEPRGLRFDGQNNLLVVERLKGISALTFRNDSTCIGWEKRVVTNKLDLEHGIQVGPMPGKGRTQFLYASSQESVFRWEYDPTEAKIIGDPVILVYNMSNPLHVTRTLIFQYGANGVPKYLIVSRGAGANLELSSGNVNAGPAQIRRFPLNGPRPAIGFAWHQGELLAWGARNSAGIAISKDGDDLWAVDNGTDELTWRGVDVHLDNPAEELNRISLKHCSSTPVERKFYGYPYCHTAWNASSAPPSTPPFNFKAGDQFSSVSQPGNPDDAWCANPKNNIRPELSMQAHSAPLDIVFYDTSKCSSPLSPFGFPPEWNGDAFVSFHGSWNRAPPTGYKVVRIPWAKNRPRAHPSSVNGYETVVGASNTTQCPTSCIRPVAVLFDKLGRMFVTSDDSGEVFVVQKSSH
ncbi:hypothetical protein CTheo_7658 [Ceratobasidium theobromae]|uniref:Pyrroloquinoline quinone-dependent pyranose dehydrogenase beta-propeller domain-containing protein n=1 Tax=Ceratobasidium theobromae TaxID=1582974 RepID=A0A5N5QBL7_9AGAM|nr:hypothetical protein CTheo_7658 [Ceratobasidium theobromae]